MPSPTIELRLLLQQDTCHVMPCCWDGLSARMISQAGFPLTFMSGFAVAAGRLGLPDTGLTSFGEMVDQARQITGAATIPVLGDGDTGYGNPLNVQRTVREYARAGLAAVMIEDQVSPKRCGHTQGKTVVDRSEAIERIQAAVEARRQDTDILILARTDARATHGLDEALARAEAFKKVGADILFVEAPQSVDELAEIPRAVPGVHMANMIEGGVTPVVPPAQLHEMGYRVAAYPLALLSAAMLNMQRALEQLAKGERCGELLMDFASVRREVGFDDYAEREKVFAMRRESRD